MLRDSIIVSWLAQVAALSVLDLKWDTTSSAGDDRNSVVDGFGISSGIAVNPREKAAKKSSSGATTTQKPVTCPYPNATTSRLHVFNCNKDLPVQIISARVVNARTNAIIYPLSNKQPMVLVVNIHTKDVIITDEQFMIYISEWGPDANGECVWKLIDTHGAFDNFNGCAFAHDCPVPKGSSQVRIPLHLERFNTVISQLKSGSVYQLELHIINTSNRKQIAEVGCAVAQGRLA